MIEPSDPLQKIQTQLRLDEINEHILHGAGEIISAPGKLSLVWTDPTWEIKRFLSVKAAGEDQIIINGRRFPATEAGLKQGLVACLSDFR